MTLKPNIAISDSGFIFDPATGNSFTTNPIGLQIMRALLQNLSETQIIEQLLNDYDSNESTVARDLSDFINLLKKLKLLDL